MSQATENKGDYTYALHFSIDTLQFYTLYFLDCIKEICHMPTVLIEVRREYTPQQENAILEAVHSALREAFELPEWDKDVRLVAHLPHRLMCRPGIEKPEYFTHISIDCFTGRSLDAKRNLYKAIVKNLEPLGIPNNQVKILLRESSRENWGIRGGQAACDIDIGFTVEV
ncbi:MAG TPA: tautomerase family protein [Burkholderiales bacterium]|nr:tautomerase family protein [Burkholderiales bacterium]